MSSKKEIDQVQRVLRMKETKIQNRLIKDAKKEHNKIKKLKEENENLKLLLKETENKLNELKIKKREIKQQRKHFKQNDDLGLPNPDFDYDQEIKRGNKALNLTVFKNNKEDINKIIDILNKHKVNNNALSLGSNPTRTNTRNNIPIVKALYRGKEVLEFKCKGKYTKEEIEQIGNEISKIEGLRGNQFAISIKYDFGWRAGKLVPFGDGFSLNFNAYEHHEQEYFYEFDIFLIERPRTDGGDNEFNNCLFNCIQSVLSDKNPFKNDCSLKKYLNIPIRDTIDIKYIPKIEEKLKSYSINVFGDYQYISPNQKNKSIDLILSDGHYTLGDDKPYRKVNKNLVSYKERIPMLYESKTFKAYTPQNGIFELSKEDKSRIYDWKTKYILVDKLDNEMSFEDEYKKFIIDADLLKKETNGLINLYKTGTHKITAFNLFNDFTKTIKKPKQIKELEATIINNASHGAIIFNSKEYKGSLCHSYDFKSEYPSIMKSQQKFPIGEGEFLTINNDEFKQRMTTYENYFGIYHCEIYKSNTDIDKCFRFNFKNWYSHIDLMTAIDLGLSYKLIEDNQPNFYFYSRDKLISGVELFGSYVDYLYELKQKGIKVSKKILNILWGGLCEKKSKNYVCKSDLDLPINSKILSISRNDINENIIIDVVQRDKFYVSGFGRLKPFLLSKARQNISKVMKPHINNIIACHTDGFKSKIKLDIKTDDKIGSLCYEGEKIYK